MADLLIHSMAEFGDLIADILALADAKRLCEIGAEFGGTSQLLADHAAAQGGMLYSIDPDPKPQFIDWAAGNAQVTHVAKPSLEAIGDMRDIDAWLIDGDHNWFTVFNELVSVQAACRRDGKPMLAILHDVGWPCARRDFYYAPDRIPAEARQPFDYDGGVVPGFHGLRAQGGFRGMGQFAWAVREGGPRNGVKTAIEDFTAAELAAGHDLAYAEIPAVFGLGVLFDMDAPWSDAVAELIMPYHQNRLIATLEANRLANYLTVIDWQDRSAA